MRPPWFRARVIVFLTLLGSFAFFWHSRDWNTASRLILTYAMVDRGTIGLDGLDQQTGDIARFQGHYYCDKLPGFSLVGTVPYVIARLAGRIPAHPLNAPAMTHWAADYWVTLGVSGLATATAAILLMEIARRLGCSPRTASLVGLAYGLATPAYVYGTLAYGHQLSAACLLGAFLLLWEPAPRQAGGPRPFLAGVLASWASVTELQVGPVSAILGLMILIQCLTRRRPLSHLAAFGIGALLPGLVLLGYNLLAFGSPWDMGYFHHATAQFAKVHNRQNPLGLGRPNLALIAPLLWGEHRGLLFYAPILLLAAPGWVLMGLRGRYEAAVVSLAICLAVFAVNLSYPEWTGGWSTGPRLLVPLLPFAMIPVAAALAGKGRVSAMAGSLAVFLACGGGIRIFLFQGVGARVPQDVLYPLRDFVWPLWTSPSLAPGWWSGERFTRNLVSLFANDWLASLGPRWQAAQFLPLLAAQAMALLLLVRLTREPVDEGRMVADGARSDLRVDEQQDRGGAHQDAHDPEAEPERMSPNPRP